MNQKSITQWIKITALVVILTLMPSGLGLANSGYRPDTAVPFEDDTTSSVDLGFTLLLFDEVLAIPSGSVFQNGGDRLTALQNDDGGWDWPLDDGNPANPSPKNTVGPIGQGLALAYDYTDDPDHLAALADAGTLLLGKQYNFSPSDGYLAATLDEIFGVTIYTDHVKLYFYGPLADGTYDRNGADTNYDTADYINLIRTSRSGSQANLAAWDIGMGLVGAAMVGADTTAWVAGVKAEIDELNSGGWYDVIGLAGAIYGLAYVDEDYDPMAGSHVAASNLTGLALILLDYQLATGGFTWSADYQGEGEGNETIQETAYAILALDKVSRPTYLSALQAAADYMESVQLATGGWEGYVGGGENNEITGEALWGIYTVYPYNQPPVAEANGPFMVAVGQSVALDHTGSYDPDGDALSYNWAVSGAVLGTVALESFTAGSVTGITEVTLTVDDGWGGTATDTAMVVVYDPAGGFVTGGGWIDSPAAQIVSGFNTIPDSLAGNYPSQPYQAQQTAEFGDHIQFAGIDRLLDSVLITMSSWACETGNWYNKDCVTTPGAGYTHPLTLNIYAVDNSGGTPVTGALLATITQDTFIPFRPSSYPACTSNGGWGASCFNGYAFNVTFDMSSLNITLPDEVIYGLAFNTQTWGYAPIGVDGYYNSLNFALVRPGTDFWEQIGVDVNSDAVFWNTKTAGYYSDGGAAGVGIFRQDTGWSGYVPAARFLFTSPGAYKADPTLGGKATFGFVSKYKKGASVPEGTTEFQFKAGGLNFHSTNYEWLVVNQGGTNAQFKGYGTINGAGNYGFMIWAGDHSPDTFRIKIWDATTEEVVYDNGTDQPIGGGNIVVHTKK